MGKKSERRAARVAAAIARRKAAGTNPLEFTFTKDGPEIFNISGEFRFHYTVQKSDLSYACQDAYGQVDIQLELDNRISSDENKARVDAALNQLICEQGEAKIKRLNAEHPGWVLMSLKLFNPTNENGEWLGACHFVGEEHEIDCGCTEPVKHSGWSGKETPRNVTLDLLGPRLTKQQIETARRYVDSNGGAVIIGEDEMWKLNKLKTLGIDIMAKIDNVLDATH